MMDKKEARLKAVRYVRSAFTAPETIAALAIDEYERLLTDDEAWREEYRAKQTAGVKFERCWMDGTWHFGVYNFNGPQKDYRIATGQVSKIPHAAEVESHRQTSYWIHSLKAVLDKCEKKEGDPEAWREEYRKKQAAGVKFEVKLDGRRWHKTWCAFDCNKECYREVQEAPKPEPTIPHAAERALYWKQRAEGTNEDWQFADKEGNWVDVVGGPVWIPNCKYRVKPKTRTVYFAIITGATDIVTCTVMWKEGDIQEYVLKNGLKIIGPIEQREVEV